MQINIISIPIAYFDDELQFYFQDQSNAHQKTGRFFEFETENLNQITKQFEKNLHLKINKDQIQYVNDLSQSPQITMIQLILIPPLDVLDDQIENWLPYSETNILSAHDQQIVKLIQTHLTHQYQIYKLKAFPTLIGKRFTTYSITAMLNRILNIHIKPNNLKRDLKNQIKVVDYDHLNRGRPKAIFELK